MATDKEIRLNVDDSALNKLRQRATDLSRDMIRASREFSTSSDEVVADLQEQISLMERRSQISEQYARNQIQQARQAGQAAPQQATQAIQQAQEDKIVVSLLREMIETIKQSSKNEIRADRDDVERRIRASRTVTQLGPAGDPIQALTETLQRGYLGGENDDIETNTQSESRNRRGRGSSRIRRGFEQVLNKAASAENEYVFLTSMLEGIPFVGKAAATVAARGISNAENFERSAINYGRINRFGRRGSPLDEGRAIGGAIGLAAANLGLTPGEALDRSTAFTGALQNDLSLEKVSSLVGAERSLGLDQNAIIQILRTSRYDQGVNDPSRILSQFDKYTKDTSQAITVIPELIGTFTSAANQILSARGEVDTQNLARVITGIGASTGFRGQRLDKLTGAFGNLGRTANPVTRALLMRSFRETDPNASFVDIQEKLEGGLSEGSRPGLQRFFEIMRERTGGGDAFTLALQTALPELSVKDIRDVVKSGGFAKSLQRSQIAGARDFTTEGQAFVGPVEKSGKQVAGALELAGDAIVQVLDELKVKIGDAISDIGGKEVAEPKTEAELKVEETRMNLRTSPI